MATNYLNKCVILSELWIDHRDDVDLEGYVAYNDLALPLAYMIFNNIVKSTPVAEPFINESFSALLEQFGISDEGFEDFDNLSDRLSEPVFRNPGHLESTLIVLAFV